jgi:hypothetical protein
MEEVKGIYYENAGVRIVVTVQDDTWLSQDELRKAAIEMLEEEV